MTDSRAVAEEGFAKEGLVPSTWSNRPGYRYDRHAHSSDKVLYCIDGSITFRTPEGEVELQSGDRLDLPAGLDHAATVGPDGVVCMEAHRPTGAVGGPV